MQNLVKPHGSEVLIPLYSDDKNETDALIE